MMQAAESRHRDDFSSDRLAFCRFSACRSLLPQPEMSPVLMVVADVFIDEPFQVAFTEHDHVVEQIGKLETGDRRDVPSQPVKSGERDSSGR